MDKQFNTIMRSGKQLDMYAEIEMLQAKYLEDLQASVDAFDNYFDVSNETYSDFKSVEQTLNLFAQLGYLYRDEAEDMIEAAKNQRTSVLEGLEGANERNS